MEGGPAEIVGTVARGDGVVDCEVGACGVHHPAPAIRRAIVDEHFATVASARQADARQGLSLLVGGEQPDEHEDCDDPDFALHVASCAAVNLRFWFPRDKDSRVGNSLSLVIRSNFQ